MGPDLAFLNSIKKTPRFKEIEISFFTLSLGIMAALPLPLPHLRCVPTAFIDHHFNYALVDQYPAIDYIGKDYDLREAMMSDSLILVEEGYEELELWVPYYRFLEAGLSVQIVGKEKEKTYAGKHGIAVSAGGSFIEASLDGVKAVVIPGGLAPDRLRLHKDALDLVRQADKKGIVIAAICHAGSVLVSAGIVSGRHLTSYRSIRDDLVAAGGKWVDEPVVIDKNLITSRTPNDLPQFLPAILNAVKG